MLLLIFFPFLILLTLAQFAQFDVLPVLMGAYYEPPEDDEHLSASIAERSMVPWTTVLVAMPLPVGAHP